MAKKSVHLVTQYPVRLVSPLPETPHRRIRRDAVLREIQDDSLLPLVKLPRVGLELDSLGDPDAHGDVVVEEVIAVVVDEVEQRGAELDELGVELARRDVPGLNQSVSPLQVLVERIHVVDRRIPLVLDEERAQLAVACDSGGGRASDSYGPAQRGGCEVVSICKQILLTGGPTARSRDRGSDRDRGGLYARNVRRGVDGGGARVGDNRAGG